MNRLFLLNARYETDSLMILVTTSFAIFALRWKSLTTLARWKPEAATLESSEDWRRAKSNVRKTWLLSEKEEPGS